MQLVMPSVASELLLNVKFVYGLMNMDLENQKSDYTASLYAVSDANPKRLQCPESEPCIQ